MSQAGMTIVTDDAPARSAPHARLAHRDRQFFSGMAIAAALTVFAGFAPTYYLRGLSDRPPLSTVLQVHGILFTAWILLFLVQTRLVARKRIAVHRRLGAVGGVLVLLMLAAGYAAAIDSARRGFTPPGGPPPLVFFIVPIADLVVFAVLAGSAFYTRRRPDTHKRLMLLATIALLTAAIARLPGVLDKGPLVFFALTDVFILVCFAYDKLTRGRVQPAFLWGGLFLIASHPARLAIGGTSAWLSLAAWLTR